MGLALTSWAEVSWVKRWQKKNLINTRAAEEIWRHIPLGPESVRRGHSRKKGVLGKEGDSQ